MFGVFFGATASEAGLSFFEIILSSATAFAGASQFVFLEVYGLRAPAWSILVAVFAVNFRHVLYSASLGRHLHQFPGFRRYVAFAFMVDPVFADSEKRAQTQTITPSFYYGYALLLYFSWIATSALGAAFGAMIEDPAAIGMDLFLPIYFMTLVIGFSSKHGWLLIISVAGAASLFFYNFVGPPWHISLGALIGIAAAVLFVKPTRSPLALEQDGEDA